MENPIASSVEPLASDILAVQIEKRHAKGEFPCSQFAIKDVVCDRPRDVARNGLILNPEIQIVPH